MVEAFLRFVQDPAGLLVPLIIFSVTLAVGWAARRILRGAMQAWIARTGSRPARILGDAIHGPFMIWMLILAVHLGVQASGLPDRHARVETWVSRVLIVLVVLSFTVMLSRLAGSLIRTYGAEIPSALPVTTLTQNLAQLAVVILGILVLLNQLGFRITPILTALGVGGLAVALALQDTLSNLFAGFYVAVAGQVRLGDYIKLNTGEEGYISDITWRSTTIRALANNLIIVPNNKLAQAIVTNFHLPEKRIAIQVPVAVGFESDIEEVEWLLTEVAVQASGEVPGLLAEPAPKVMFDPGLTEHGIVFSVGCHVEEFVNQFGVKHELRKRIFHALRERRIATPFPAKMIVIEQSETNRRGSASEG